MLNVETNDEINFLCWINCWTIHQIYNSLWHRMLKNDFISPWKRSLYKKALCLTPRKQKNFRAKLPWHRWFHVLARNNIAHYHNSFHNYKYWNILWSEKYGYSNGKGSVHVLNAWDFLWYSIIAFCKVTARSRIFRHIGFFSRVFVTKS